MGSEYPTLVVVISTYTSKQDRERVINARRGQGPATGLRRRHDAAEWARTELGFAADEAQAEVLRSTKKRGLLNCTRQWGKSTVTAAKAIHQAVHFPESLTVVVSPSARQSGEFLRKATGFARKLGIKPKGDGDNEISLELPNRSRIVGLPGSEATVRGFSAVSLLLVDEAARVSDELYLAIRPMLAVSDGALWLMSTPFGKRGILLRSVGERRAGLGAGPRFRRRSVRGSDGSSWRRSGRRWGNAGSGRSICANSKRR
jgi:hypothetical protein